MKSDDKETIAHTHTKVQGNTLGIVVALTVQEEKDYDNSSDYSKENAF